MSVTIPSWAYTIYVIARIAATIAVLRYTQKWLVSR